MTHDASTPAGRRGLPARHGVSPLGIAAGMLVIYVVWGSTYLAIRFGVETMPPFLMAGTRFLVAGAILYGWLRMRGAARPAIADWQSALFLGALLLLGGNGFVTWAEQWLASGVAALVITTTPLWMMLFEWLLFRGRRPALLVWIGVAVGFGGVMLLIQPGANDQHAAPALAWLAICAAPVVWSLGSLLAQRTRQLTPPLMTTALHMLCGGGLMFAVGLGLGEARDFDLASVSLKSWFSLLYLVTLGSLLAFTTYMWLLRVAPPTVVATYAYVNPLVAVLVGAAFGGEALTADVGLAAAMIVGAVALISLRGRSRRHESVDEQAAAETAKDDVKDPSREVRLAECDG